MSRLPLHTTDEGLEGDVYVICSLAQAPICACFGRVAK